MAQGNLIRGTQQTASGGRLQSAEHGTTQQTNISNNGPSLVESQNLLSSGNVINNNFNIINNFMGTLPDSQQQTATNSNSNNATTAPPRASSSAATSSRLTAGQNNVFSLNGGSGQHQPISSSLNSNNLSAMHQARLQ